MNVPGFFIKNVRIPIDKNYAFENTPFIYEPEEAKINASKLDMYFPKKELEQKFIEFLRTNKGSYLVTGYRGSGKTSFVNKVISSYNANEESIPGTIQNQKTAHNYADILTPIRLNLAQSTLSEIDVLRMMVAQVYNQYFNSEAKREENIIKKREKQKLNWWYIGTAIFLFLIIMIVWKAGDIKSFLSVPYGIISAPIGESFGKYILYAGIIYVSFIYYKKLRKKYNKIFIKNSCAEAEERLSVISKRCYASVSVEESNVNEISFIDYFKFSGRSKKHAENLPVATTREIEHELSVILYQLKDLHKFIFIFDELDKIDPPVSTTSYYQEIDFTKNDQWNNNYLESQRARKQAVINLIASLKNFITTTEASFVFIAGREMFDASLADVADRQSSLGSIFNYVFNIDSFLKEKVEGNSSLSKNIERYLCRIIFGKKDDKQLFTHLLNAESEVERDIKIRELFKVSLLLQNFIIYLTYRTNGSPKRLIRTIHEFIRVGDEKEKEKLEKDKGKTIYFETGNEGSSKTQYLYFNYHAQYKIGFINYLYRPFLIKYGRNFKQYSDNIITSTSYLFDHLLKFHPFGFNMSSLELIPEVLSTNKTPTTKEHLKRIVEYLMNSHVKETEIGLFNYKFYNRTLNELSYQSKIFETESAAFNFTLDESYLVKAHVRNKIKELRSIYAKFNENVNGKDSQIHSISFMNDILGDLHFFDEEYDDSIVAYSDGIKTLEYKPMEDISYKDFVTLVLSMLKIGLCYEKTTAYEKALSWYTDACNCAIKFISYQTQNSVNKTKDTENQFLYGQSPATFKFSTIIELLQMSNQAFLAMAIMEEKMSIENNSVSKLPKSVGNFFNLLNSLHDSGISEHTHMIRANTYLVTANMFYYRNTRSGDINKFNVSENKLELLKKNMELVAKFYESQPKPAHRYPSFSLALYFTGLDELLQSKSGLEIKNEIVNENENIVEKTLEIFLRRDYAKNIELKFTKYHFKYLSIFLSCIGDCLLASLKRTGKNNKLFPSQIFYVGLLKFNSRRKQPRNFGVNLDFLFFLNKDCFLGKVIKYYYLSAFYFVKRGRSLSASFQLRKILYILKSELYDYFPVGKEEMIKDAYNDDFLDVIYEFIITPLLYFTDKNAEHTENHMYNKFVHKFETSAEILKESSSKFDYKTYFKYNLSNHPETREVSLLYCYISLKIKGEVNDEYSELVNSFNSIATQHSRIMELEYFSLLCRRNFESAKNDDEKIQSAVGYISALVNTIRILTFYGSDYMIGFSHQANIYYKIGSFYKHIREKDTELFDKITQGLEDFMGNEYSYSLYETPYYFKMAKFNYEKAIQLHSTGSEYNKALEGMIYLEDDFNDNAYHFGAALDRYFMINDVFTNRINKCNKLMDE